MIEKSRGAVGVSGQEIHPVGNLVNRCGFPQSVVKIIRIGDDLLIGQYERGGCFRHVRIQLSFASGAGMQLGSFGLVDKTDMAPLGPGILPPFRASHNQRL